MNKALCPVVSCPAPHQSSVRPLSPPSQTREYYLLLPLLEEGRQSLGGPPPFLPSSGYSEPEQLWLCPQSPGPPKRTSLRGAKNIKVRPGLEPQAPASPACISLWGAAVSGPWGEERNRLGSFSKVPSPSSTAQPHTDTKGEKGHPSLPGKTPRAQRGFKSGLGISELGLPTRTRPELSGQCWQAGWRDLDLRLLFPPHTEQRLLPKEPHIPAQDLLPQNVFLRAQGQA